MIVAIVWARGKGGLGRLCGDAIEVEDASKSKRIPNSFNLEAERGILDPDHILWHQSVSAPGLWSIGLSGSGGGHLAREGGTNRGGFKDSLNPTSRAGSKGRATGVWWWRAGRVADEP